MLFDKDLRIVKIPRPFGPYQHIVLSNNMKRIEIKGPVRTTEEWMADLVKVRKESPWVANHRYGSFAPIRENVKAKWFVDGQGISLYVKVIM